jgi:hypothetical protein
MSPLCSEDGEPVLDGEGRMQIGNEMVLTFRRVTDEERAELVEKCEQDSIHYLVPRRKPRVQGQP